MRIPSVVFFVCFSTTLALGQGSTRLLGMGNVSIAVPDPQSELFANPARISQIGGLMIQANPFYQPYSGESSSGSSSTNPGTSSSSSSHDEWSNSQLTGSMLATLSLDVLHFGGTASLGSGTTASAHAYSSQSGYYSSSSKEDGSSSLSSWQALASIDLGFLSVGASARFGKHSTTETYYSNSSYGTSSSWSQDEYESSEDPRNYVVGMYVGSPSSFEVSASFETYSSRFEHKTTAYTSSGTPPPSTSPFPISYVSSSGNRLTALVRASLGKILLGVRATRTGTTDDLSYKFTWYDLPYPNTPVYEERNTGHDESTGWEYGAGLAWNSEHIGTLAFEYLVGPATTNTTSFYAAQGTQSNGSKYHRGDIQSEGETNLTYHELRAGAELFVTEGITLRAGSQVHWAISDFSETDNYSSGRTFGDGQRASTFTGHLGATISLGILRFDYALTAGQLLAYVSGYPYGLPGQDVVFTHQATVTIIL